MHDWKSELDALVAETAAFARSLKVDISRPQPNEAVEQGTSRGPDYGGNQERFMREREEYADSLMRRIKPITKR